MTDNKFYGLYAGVCVDNADPHGRSRIRLRVPQVLGAAMTNWADACLPVTATGQHSHHSATITSSANGAPSHTHTVGVDFSHTDHKKTPDINQQVWVMFIGGDPNFPVWIGVSL